MSKLYLMRHGQTLFNMRKIAQGICDSPLTKTGVDQAKMARRYIEKNFKIDRLYCSTLLRSETTARIVSDLEIVRLEGLREGSYGRLEGQSEDLLRNPAVSMDGLDDDTIVAAGGESQEECSSRFSKCIKEIVDQNDGENILAVSHGGVIAFFYVEHQGPWKGSYAENFDNCCILEFDVNDDTKELAFVKIHHPIAEV